LVSWLKKLNRFVYSPVTWWKMSSIRDNELGWGIIGKEFQPEGSIHMQLTRGIGCGMISSWFVSDLMLPRTASSVKHKLEAIGSSSVKKAQEFTQAFAPKASPSLYASYDEVYNDSNVNIVYIGTPHSLHYENALAAIAAGKHVLCEKPLTINAKQAESLIEAAKQKNVYLMEGNCILSDILGDKKRC
jgi:hypothetical protein